MTIIYLLREGESQNCQLGINFVVVTFILYATLASRLTDGEFLEDCTSVHFLRELRLFFTSCNRWSMIAGRKRSEQ
jgi:hypothetical protein